MADWRLDVLLEAQRSERTVKEICDQHEIARSTFYEWKKRFEVAGIAGLLERSRQPIRQPRRITSDLEDLICQLRRDHPRWGAKTIRARLKRMSVAPPAVSTIHRTLVRNHLVRPQPAKKPKALMRRFERKEPNDLWQMDATTEHLADGSSVEIVSVLDDHARFLLASTVVAVTTAEATWSTFKAAATAYGLPRQVLTDNHLSFTGRLYGIEVSFERQLRGAGVELINGAPSHPQTQGKIERFHQTLHDWFGDHERPRSLQKAQQELDRFGNDYNQNRPHQSLADSTPSERYRPSPRKLVPRLLDEPIYPDDAILRRVDRHGCINYQSMKVSIGHRFAGRTVRVVAGVHDELKVYYGNELSRALFLDRSRFFQALPKSSRAG